VSDSLRESHARSQIVLSACDAHRQDLVEALRRLDMLLLMGPPSLRSSAISLIGTIEQLLDQQASPAPSKRKAVGTEPTPRPAKRTRSDAIPRVDRPSLHAFFTEYMQKRTPVILTGCMDAWPAMGGGGGGDADSGGRAWRDLEYLRRMAGRRTVPVEVGKGTYLSADWGQRLMTVSAFIDEFVLAEGGGSASASASQGKGYLAQHELFQQVPQLRRDILVPDYCALGALEGEEDPDAGPGDDVVVNAWFGPAGTVSPTHTDPYHNLLAQVVGAKYVRIYHPRESARLYPCKGIMSNTSQVRGSGGLASSVDWLADLPPDQVDVKHPDLERFPDFASAEYVDCVLESGEMLYIPPYFWHAIESREVSFSVNFWWGKTRRLDDISDGPAS
jgi:[protein]-arginine 3-hydroxylase / protease